VLFHAPTENHELCVSLLEEEFDELKSIATQPVLVGNHDFSDSASVYSFQKGMKTFPFVVETGADVLDDFMLWVLVSEVCDLSFEIWFLVGAGDSGVTDFRFLSFAGRSFFLVEESFHIIESVESKSTRGSKGPHSSIAIPSLQSAGGDSILLLNFGCRDISTTLIRLAHAGRREVE
jgi:hypothetical protein